MLSHLRRYDVQARYAFALVVLSLLPCALALWLGWRNFDAPMGRIIYGEHGRFVPGFAGCIFLSLAPAAVGFILGVNSAGQRRNDKSGRSWLAFFLGGTVISVDLILLIAFYMLRLERPG
jgi:hypothetical protein